MRLQGRREGEVVQLLLLPNNSAHRWDACELTARNPPAALPSVPSAVLMVQKDPGCFSEWRSSSYLG